MKKNVIALFAVLTVASLAHASGDIMGDFGPIGVTSYVTVSPFYSSEATSKSMKLVEAAEEDIAYFVASEGQIRTARFENALAYTKQNFNVGNANDLEIAQALLNDIQ